MALAAGNSLRLLARLATLVATLAFSTGESRAYSTAAGFTASDYATGFPESPSSRIGPIGIAFDQSDNLYVADETDGNLYRFQPGGGMASDQTRLNRTPIPGAISGLAFSSTGNLYMGRRTAGDVVEVDPDNGQIRRVIARLPCASGLAVDPASGDLFVSENLCGTTIYRISNPNAPAPTLSAYASAPAVDGLAFDRDGDLYAESAGNVILISGTRSLTPGVVQSIAPVPHGDGLAFGAHTSGSPPFLVVNRNDGIVTRVNLRQQPPAKTDIYTGGSRGDFAAVDSLGCLYITQSSSVVRIAGHTRCAFAPTTPATTKPSPGVAAPVVQGRCTRIRTLTLRLRQRGRVRLRSATIYINGHRVKTVGSRSINGSIVLKRLPTSGFTLKVVAITTKGKKLITTRFFAQCHPVRHCCPPKRIVVRLPALRHHQRIIRVDAFIGRRRIVHLRGHRLTRVVLRQHLPAGRFTVRLVLVGSRGEHLTIRRSFGGCRK